MRYGGKFHATRGARLLAASALLTAGVGGSVLLGAGTAMAGPCGGPTVAGTSCDTSGTATITGGSLTLAMPSTLSFATTLNGTNQQVVDTLATDKGYAVDDATGSGAGWHVTTAATTFSNSAATNTLADTGTFVTTGDVGSETAITGPSAACSSTATCTLPTNTTTYPVSITTAASSPTPVTIYDTSAGTGIGLMSIGGSTAAHPVGWWINVPANTPADTYTSTVTMEIISGP
jgi:WxL domain surface cell wall-binding